MSVEPEVAGSAVSEQASEPPPQACGSRHPLLEDVWCERLKGHPGRHGAVAETNAAELTLEWGAHPDSQAADDGG